MAVGDGRPCRRPEVAAIFDVSRSTNASYEIPVESLELGQSVRQTGHGPRVPILCIAPPTALSRIKNRKNSLSLLIVFLLFTFVCHVGLPAGYLQEIILRQHIKIGQAKEYPAGRRHVGWMSSSDKGVKTPGIGVVCSGCTCTPQGGEKNFSGVIYRENV